jgi:hypothetical protein
MSIGPTPVYSLQFRYQSVGQQPLLVKYGKIVFTKNDRRYGCYQPTAEATRLLNSTPIDVWGYFVSLYLRHMGS